VVASMNAFVLLELMGFGDDTSGQPSDWQNPDPESQRRAICLAMVHTLWRASQSDDSKNPSQPKLCIPRKMPHISRSSAFTPDGVTERLEVLSASSRDELLSLVHQHLTTFMHPEGYGVVLLLYSIILTRGVGQVRSDMDKGFGGEKRSLIDNHGYLSQEGVNLILSGRGVSNVFDGERTLEDDIGGSDDVIRLGGVTSQGPVGFLTLQEAYNYLEVGECYKYPKRPIWVIYSESHYSVMFATEPQLSQLRSIDTPVDVYYWDMLANQDEVIRLTAEPNLEKKDIPDVNDEKLLIPPLDLVLRTKWQGCLVDWNGSEPLL